MIRPRTIVSSRRLGIFHVLIDWIADGKAVYVLGGGSNIYQFIHADDLAELCIRAVGRPGISIYNAGADEYGTMRETLQAVIDHAGTGSRVRSLPMAPTTFAMSWLSKLRLLPFAPYHSLMYGRDFYFDTNKAKSELDWSPEYGNTQMFTEDYDWFVENRDNLTSGTGASLHKSGVKCGLLGIIKRLS